jgi:hypothetical protein
MSEALLRLSPTVNSGLLIELVDPEGSSFEDEQGSTSIGQLLRLVEELEQGAQEQWSGDADRAMRDLERKGAELMDQILCGDSRIRGRLAWLARSADAEGHSLRLGLEIHDEALARIPWELVAGVGKGSSPLSSARVIRIMTGSDRAWAPTGSWLEIHCTGPMSLGSDLTDPGGIGEGLADLDSVHVVQPGIAIPPSNGGSPYRIHHCRVLGEGLVSLDEEPPPPNKALTVVELLGRGEYARSHSPRQAWKMGNGGPVICARGPMFGGVGVVAWDSLYRALAGGLSLENAVEAVRDGLRLLCHGHPDSRWWSLMFLVPEGDLGSVPVPISVRERLQGVPRGSLEGEAVLSRVRNLGSRVGYMGLEHLVRALLDQGSEDPLFQSAVPGLSLLVERHEELSGSPGEPRPTPRFRSLLGELSAGFDALELLARLVQVPWLARNLDPFVVDRLRNEREDTEESILLSSHDGLEVRRRRLILEGGPEDGRVIMLPRAGLVIGRWDPARPELREGRLYIDSSCVDRTVSRSAMIWQGGDWVELCAELRVEQVGYPSRPISGRVQIAPGDRIWLGSATCVRLLA